VADPFLERTVARGLARLDRHGRGIDVGADGLVAGRGGKPTPGLYAVGPLTAGRLLEITAVPEIRLQVAEIAGAVAGHLTAVRHPAFGLKRGGSR